MAKAYTLGDVLPFWYLVTTAAGAPADATAVTVTITLPDGTLAGPFTVTSSPTGTYGYNYTSTMAGRHVGNWQATGTNAGGEPQAFYVSPAVPIVTLGEIKAFLSVTTAADDDELLQTIADAVPIVESITGPLTPQTLTQTVDGGRVQYATTYVPVSIISVTENGRTLTAGTEYQTNLLHGTITRGSTYFTWPFFDGAQNVAITYTVGPTVVPVNVQRAVKELVKYLWRQTHGGPQSFQDGYVSAAAVAGVSDAMMARLRFMCGKSLAGPSVL